VPWTWPDWRGLGCRARARGDDVGRRRPGRALPRGNPATEGMTSPQLVDGGAGLRRAAIGT
jgi:hypothetical protein